MHVDPKVIFATNINLKMVGGRLFLNATSEMHIYFDKETSAGETCFYNWWFGTLAYHLLHHY
ncbi:hypothetical protein Bca4012_057149 [Brassica carinata]